MAGAETRYDFPVVAVFIRVADACSILLRSFALKRPVSGEALLGALKRGPRSVLHRRRLGQ
ncbi:hypothetical protein [Bradyrhizobium erythrophlei]|uniref:hypothetical protein n=1 Tax=Bradyrhizobium erythrophlei TaxID=1437360 RepID=UPI000B8866D8|nr:hypothetical protein [Bradyrhizobium erythrophlei]